MAKTVNKALTLVPSIGWLHLNKIKQAYVTFVLHVD